MLKTMNQMETVASEKGASPRGRVVSWLRSAIDDGQLCDGEIVPSERRLCKMLEVSRPTVRAALASAVDMGWIEQSNGRLRRVAPKAPAFSSILAQSVAIITKRELMADAPNVQPTESLFIQLSALRALAGAGLHGLVIHPNQVGEQGLESLVRERPRGVLAFNTSLDGRLDAAAIERLTSAGVPTVVSADVWQGEGVDAVGSDHEAGAYALTRFLLQRGRRRVLRFWELSADGTHREAWLGRRDAGYKRALREANLPILPAIEFHELSNTIPQSREEFESKVRMAAGYLIEAFHKSEPPDAIMCITDSVAYVVAKALQLFGEDVARSIDVVGYDNYWPHRPERQWAPPPLASVDKRNGEIGREMVRVLLETPPQSADETTRTLRLIKPDLIEIPSSF